MTYLWVHGCPWWKSCPFCSNRDGASDVALQVLVALSLRPDQREREEVTYTHTVREREREYIQQRMKSCTFIQLRNNPVNTTSLTVMAD